MINGISDTSYYYNYSNTDPPSSSPTESESSSSNGSEAPPSLNYFDLMRKEVKAFDDVLDLLPGSSLDGESISVSGPF
jgi:hypothetical protein